MMDWSDEAVVLSVRPHGETAAIVEVLARTHGRWGGLVHGGASRRTRPALQPGNVLSVAWTARVADQLGRFGRAELTTPYAARALNDGSAIAAIASATALLRVATAERQPYPGLFDALLVMLEALDTGEIWPALYPRFELGLLAALGYGLDLSACALTGVRDDLAFVSPRTGRAASRAAGAPLAEKLLALPPFLTDPSADIAPGDIADAFALAGFFLERRVFDPLGQGPPDARRRLIEALGHSGRL